MVAIAGDDAVLADLERRLQPDRDRFLADIEMAEAADQAEAVKLAGALLEAADEQHLAVEFEQLVLARLVALGLGRALAVGRRRAARRPCLCCGALRRCCLGHSSGPFLVAGWRFYGGKRGRAQHVRARGGRPVTVVQRAADAAAGGLGGAVELDDHLVGTDKAELACAPSRRRGRDRRFADRADAERCASRARSVSSRASSTPRSVFIAAIVAPGQHAVLADDRGAEEIGDDEQSGRRPGCPPYQDHRVSDRRHRRRHRIEQIGSELSLLRGDWEKSVD